MKTLDRFAHGFVAAFVVLALSACNLFTPAQQSAAVQAVENPNNIGKAVQAGVQIAATPILARNPSYASDFVAAADALIALANSNPGSVTQADIQASLARMSIAPATQTEIASYATSALSVFESSFNVTFPKLKPNYAIYLDAVANGLFGALGRTASEVPLPVIPWPAPAAPTPTPAPAS